MANKATPRILIVEDNATFRETMRELLRDMGYKVRGARNLSKAVKRLTHHNFDLVLSDVEIGDGTGFDVLKVAHERQRRPHHCARGAQRGRALFAQAFSLARADEGD
jgi:CheY-like chemotaxis protein